MKFFTLLFIAGTLLAAPIPDSELDKITPEQIEKTKAHRNELIKDAEKRADDAEKEAKASRDQTAIVGAKLEQTAADLTTIQKAFDAEHAAKEEAQALTAKEKARADHQEALAWKWRLVSIVLVLLVTGFFIARQYFPFLKVF